MQQANLLRRRITVMTRTAQSANAMAGAAQNVQMGASGVAGVQSVVPGAVSPANTINAGKYLNQ